MSLPTIVQAVSSAVHDFAAHAGSTPPISYFVNRTIPHADEDPWEGWPEHELERVRLRLVLDYAERQARVSRGLRTGSVAELRRLGQLAGTVA